MTVSAEIWTTVGHLKYKTLPPFKTELGWPTVYWAKRLENRELYVWNLLSTCENTHKKNSFTLFWALGLICFKIFF